jgi:Ca2+-binding EF-hand superfamily protein
MRALPGLTTLFIALITPGMALPTAAVLQKSFDRLDHNHNRSLSLVEWDQHAFAFFKATDKNNDNEIDPTEIIDDTETVNSFARSDSNRDGRLSIDEFMQLRRQLFRVADINADDTIERTEYDLYRLISEAGWEDVNHNSRLDLPEIRNSLQELIKLADRDHDGNLSAEEAGFLPPEVYARLTANGPLTAAQLYTHYRDLLTGEK